MNYSAITLAAALLGAAAPNDQNADDPCAIAPSNWSFLTTMPKPGPGGPNGRAVNIISIDQSDDLLWNGDSVRQDELQKYLGIVKQMPMNTTLTVLAADPRADCRFVLSIREIINITINCSPDSCAAVSRDKVESVPSQLRLVSHWKS